MQNIRQTHSMRDIYIFIDSRNIIIYFTAAKELACLHAPPANRLTRAAATVKRAQTRCVALRLSASMRNLPSVYSVPVQFRPVWFRCFNLLVSAILTPVQNNLTRVTSRTPLHTHSRAHSLLYHERALPAVTRARECFDSTRDGDILFVLLNC